MGLGVEEDRCPKRCYSVAHGDVVNRRVPRIEAKGMRALVGFAESPIWIFVLIRCATRFELALREMDWREIEAQRISVAEAPNLRPSGRR